MPGRLQLCGYKNSRSMNQLNPPKMPRWVKVSGLGAILFVIAFVIYHLTGHGFQHHHR